MYPFLRNRSFQFMVSEKVFFVLVEFSLQIRKADYVGIFNNIFYRQDTFVCPFFGTDWYFILTYVEFKPYWLFQNIKLRIFCPHNSIPMFHDIIKEGIWRNIQLKVFFIQGRIEKVFITNYSQTIIECEPLWSYNESSFFGLLRLSFSGFGSLHLSKRSWISSLSSGTSSSFSSSLLFWTE